MDTEGVHRIANTENPSRQADIVFMHGLGGFSHSTWRHGREGKDGHFFWPEELGKDLKQCGLWVVGYPAGFIGFGKPGMIIEKRAGNLSLKLASASLGERPLIFIVHSMGGLILKSLIVDSQTHADPDRKRLVSMIRAIVFCATPHRGAPFVEAFARLGRFLGGLQDQVNEMRTNADPLDFLHDKFIEWQRQNSVLVESYAESSELYSEKLLGRVLRLGFVVPRASANPNIAGATVHDVGGDHLSLVKPSSRQHDVYAGVLRFIKRTLNERVTPVTLSPTLHQLPPPVDLVGRDDAFAIIEKKLASSDDSASVSAKRVIFHGMGGVGKTALAVAVAHRIQNRFPDAQLYLNLQGSDPKRRQPTTPVEAMRSVILAFKPTAQLPEDLDALAPLYWSVLAKAKGVLLLLDNAANANQVKSLLPPPNCILFVTSRAQFKIAGTTSVSLGCLAPSKSRMLMRSLAPRLGRNAGPAAELCGHLPLALEVFAGAVNDQSTYAVAELVERLRSRTDKLAPVEAAFEISWEILTVEMRHRWAMLTVFPSSFDLRAVATIWEMDTDSAQESMQALVNASLVEWNGTTKRYRTHDLVRHFCAGKLRETDYSAARLRHARHYRDVASEADALYQKGSENVLGGLDFFDRERDQIENAFEWLFSRRNESDAALLVSLVDSVGDVARLRFDPRQRIRWLEAGRDAARAIGDRVAEGNATIDLGSAYRSLGDTSKAFEFHEKALSMYRENSDRSGEGRALGELGNDYYVVDEERKAIELYEQSLIISREFGHRSQEAATLGNLGLAQLHLGVGPEDPRDSVSTIMRLLNNRRTAVKFFEQQLELIRDIGDLEFEATALDNLGTSHRMLMNPRKSIEFHDLALTIRRKMKNDACVASSLWGSALAYAADGDKLKAISCAEESLRILDRLEEPGAARVRAQLAQWREESVENPANDEPVCSK